jgi:hypothetical protein
LEAGRKEGRKEGRGATANGVAIKKMGTTPVYAIKILAFLEGWTLNLGKGNWQGLG